MLRFKNGRITWHFGNDYISVMHGTTETRFNQLRAELHKLYPDGYGLTEVKQVLSQLK